MSEWGPEAWASDDAADWLGLAIEKSGLPSKVAKALSGDVTRKPEVARAACWLLVQLGRVYVWPVESLDADLDAGIAALEKLKKHEIYEGDTAAQRAMSAELRTLRARRAGKG